MAKYMGAPDKTEETPDSASSHSTENSEESTETAVEVVERTETDVEVVESTETDVEVVESTETAVDVVESTGNVEQLQDGCLDPVQQQTSEGVEQENAVLVNGVEENSDVDEIRGSSGASTDSDPHIPNGSMDKVGEHLVKESRDFVEVKNKECKEDFCCNNASMLEELEDLKKQLQQSLMAHSSAEELVSKLQTSLSIAEQKVQELTSELAEVHKKMDGEVTSRDKKYSELDVKFGKLQKRAKQRIQELQKEKEDVESQLAGANEKASQALSQCTSLQHDMERVRAQAGEALRSLDAERQQLRNINNKQKEQIEDIQRSLEAKAKEEKEFQRHLSEKEQVVNELTDKMMEMEEKHAAAIADLVTKHKKLIEDLEAQLAEAVHERNKSSETVASLQTQLAQKESQIAEIDAASSGEAIRLSASLEAAKGDLSRIEQEHKKERDSWDGILNSMKLKLEESERLYLQQQIEAAKEKSQIESELHSLQQALNVAQSELVASREQVAAVEKEFSAYKVRAYSLLQKKEAELFAAKDAEKLASQEAALKEAQRLAAAATAERDRAVKKLQDAMTEHENQLAAKSGALLDAQQKIRELATKLESTRTRMQLEQEAMQSHMNEINAAWEEKYKILQQKDESCTKLEKELMLIRESYNRLMEENDAFQKAANNTLESKDREIVRLSEEIKEIQRALSDAPKASSREASSVLGNLEREHEHNLLSNIEAGEHQILILARQQAQREEELAQCHRHIQALQDEIVELEHENRLHSQQEAALKEELRNLERSKKREGVDMTYLKNVILKLLETGEVEVLLPVISMLLAFSPDEVKKCQEIYSAGQAEPTAAAADGPRTLLSRFLFSKAGK